MLLFSCWTEGNRTHTTIFHNIPEILIFFHYEIKARHLLLVFCLQVLAANGKTGEYSREGVILCILMHFFTCGWYLNLASVDQPGFYLLKQGWNWLIPATSSSYNLLCFLKKMSFFPCFCSRNTSKQEMLTKM